MIESPCVRLCTLDDEQICLGCHRSLSEICAWGEADDEGKRAILARCAERRAERPEQPWPRGHRRRGR